MKTNFKNLKELIMNSDTEDYLTDHDLNVTILNTNLKQLIKAYLDLTNLGDVSRFLTMFICFSENNEIDDEIVNWTACEYRQYLHDIDIDEKADRDLVKEFLRNF